MSDGTLIFDTKLDNKELSKDLDRMKKEFEENTKSIAETDKQVERLEKQLDKLNKKRNNLARDEIIATNKQLDNLYNKQYKMRELYGDKAKGMTAFKSTEYDIKQLERYKGDLASGEALPKGWEKVENAINDVNRQLDEYKNKLTELETANLRLNASATNMVKDALPSRLERAKQKIVELSKALGEKLSNSFKSAVSSMNIFNKNMKKSKNSSDNLLGGIFKLGNMFKLLAMRMVMRGAIKAFQEGFKTLISQSSDTNKAFSKLHNSMATFKNSIVSMFAPLIQVLAPILAQVVDMVTTVSNKIAELFGALTGKSTIEIATKQQKDYAKSLDNTTESTKKLSKASFDTINQLNSNVNTTSNTEKAFETVKISNEMSNKANEIKRRLEPLINSFEKLFGIFRDIGNWVNENIYKPLSEWVQSEVIPRAITIITKAVEILNKALKNLEPVWDWLWKNIIKPIGEWTAQTFLDTMDLVIEQLELFDKWLNGDITTAEMFSKSIDSAWNFIKKVFEPISNWIEQNLISPIRQGWYDFVNGLITAWESFVNSCIDGVNSIKRVLNTLHFDLPDWLGGGSFGFNFKMSDYVHYDRVGMASGTIEPRMSMHNPMLKGTYEQENRERAMQRLENFKNNGIPNLNNNVSIKFEGDLAQLGKVLNPVIENEKKRVGTSLTKGAKAW